MSDETHDEKMARLRAEFEEILKQRDLYQSQLSAKLREMNEETVAEVDRLRALRDA